MTRLSSARRRLRLVLLSVALPLGFSLLAGCSPTRELV